MADVFAAFGAFGILVALVVAVLLPVLFVIGIWRIGTGLKVIGFALNNHGGQKSAAESLELIAESMQNEEPQNP